MASIINFSGAEAAGLESIAAGADDEDLQESWASEEGQDGKSW